MDPVSVTLITTTVVSTLGAIVAIFRKNIRNIACFGRNCINFRSGNTPPRGESPPVLDFPPVRNEPIVRGELFHGTPSAHPSNININFDGASAHEPHNIKITQI